MRWTGVLLRVTSGALVVALATVPAQAQRNETLSGNRRNTDFGGFGGPVVKFTRVAGEDVVMNGGRGGLIVNRRLVIGGGGYSLARDNIRTGFRFDNGDAPDLRFDYGGVELEFITRPSKLVHATFYTLIGGGQARYSSERTTGGSVLSQSLGSDVFVIEPAVNVELNVTNWFRLGFGAGYRHVDGSDLPRVSDASLSSGVGTLTFKFGAF